MNVQTATMTIPDLGRGLLDDAAGAALPITVRTGRSGDAAALHGLIEDHADEGRLLPRTLADLTTHGARFVVALAGARVVGCAELAPLSSAVAEVRSLVVHRDARGDGVGGRLVQELVRRAQVNGFDTLSAFTHGPAYFIRLGFSIVPHAWMREKIVADCQSCALFRTCGQHAVVLSLTGAGRGGRPVRS